MNKNSRNALLLSACIMLGTLTGCTGKDNNQKRSNVQNTVSTEYSKVHLYDSTYYNMFEITKLKKDSILYDRNANIARKSNEDDIFTAYSLNNEYVMLMDTNGFIYFTKRDNLEIINTDVDEYYAYVINKTAVYKEPLDNNYTHTGEIIYNYQLVKVIKDFGEKVYAIDESGKAIIIRKIDIIKLPDSFIDIDTDDLKLVRYENNNKIYSSPIIYTNNSRNPSSIEGYYQIDSHRSSNKKLDNGIKLDYWIPISTNGLAIYSSEDNIVNGNIGVQNNVGRNLYQDSEVGMPILIHK